MSRVSMPFAPKAKLTEILQRRGQTLASWMGELGFTMPLQVELYCMINKLQSPSTDELLSALTVIVKPQQTVAPVLAIALETNEKPAKTVPVVGKKLRNGLVKTEAPETTPSEPLTEE